MGEVQSLYLTISKMPIKRFQTPKVSKEIFLLFLLKTFFFFFIVKPIKQMFLFYRPRRVQSDLTPNMLPKLEEDPSMVENLANRLFPQLSIENKLKPSFQQTTSISCVSVQDGEKSVTLPSLSVDQNYSQMLQEIVAHF